MLHNTLFSRPRILKKLLEGHRPSLPIPHSQRLQHLNPRAFGTAAPMTVPSVGRWLEAAHATVTSAAAVAWEGSRPSGPRSPDSKKVWPRLSLICFTDNSLTNQLAENDIWTFRHAQKCSRKYESCTPFWVHRFSLERRRGINVLCITTNASQWTAVMYETWSDW